MTMTWNDDVSYAMSPFKLFTLPIGGWPLQEYNTFALVRFLISWSGVCVAIIITYLNIYYDCSDMYEKIDSLMLFVCFFLALLKLSAFRIYADNLTSIFSSAISDYLAIDSEEKHTIMRRHAFMGRKIFCCVLFGYIAAIGIMVEPIMSSDNNVQVNLSINKQVLRYPLPTSCTLANIYLPTGLYVMIYVVQCILLYIGATGNTGNDSLFLAITLHVCGQMELLRIEFSNLSERDKNVNKDFLNLVTRHTYLLNQAKLLLDTISFTLLVQLLMSCVLISIIGFQFILALKVGDLVMTVKTTMVLLTFLTQLFVYSVVSEYLKYQVEEFAHSIYCCDWHCLSVRLMKNVLFIIARSQQPIQFAAGNFFVVNMGTFMSILRTSFSYLSVLRMTLNT